MSRLLIIALAAAANLALAGGLHGTLDFDEIDDLLAQDQAISDRIKEDFDIFRVGDAKMIDRSENEKLNGARMGPYSFVAKPKGAAGPYTYELIIETVPTFLDKSGHPVPLPKATDFKEKLKDILIRPLRPGHYFTPLPGQ